MSNLRKLSAFRQLSLDCATPTAEQRRKTLKKQFSQDLPELRDALDGGGIKISLNSKARNFDRPPAIKIAWEENSELKTEEAVLVRRCKDVRKASAGRLSRQTSLEKDSILHSKQEIAERLKRQHVKEKERQERTNLEIFLAHNPVEHREKLFEKETTPKLIQPLLTARANDKNAFQIQRNKHKIDLHEMAYSPTRSEDSRRGRGNAVVVVPVVEKIERCSDGTEEDGKEIEKESNESKEELKPIDSVIIRPATAASRREKFQRRSNSAFSATIKESQVTR